MSAPPSNKPIRVLYMEDDEGLASLVKKKLLRENFETDIAVNGEEGLAMLRQGAYDIVAIDYDIPVYNGLEVIHEMLTGENSPPTIMITGVGSEALAVEAMKLGVGDYVVKDFDGRYIELIPTVIRRVLKQHKLALEKEIADEALKRAKDELELKVKERTKELNRANRELIKELNERIETERKLRESEKRLRFLSSELMTTQERERKRIAQELHDSIGQYLTTIKLRIRQVHDNIPDPDKAPVLESLNTITTIVQETIGEVRKIVMDLRPSILDDLGIQATIRWFCREFRITYSNIEITEEIDIKEEELPDDLKIVIYRILQEALNNVAKHSKADHISLSLFKEEDFVVLKIEDNGIGLDVSRITSHNDSRTHFGLTGMKERTELSGGSFSVESEKGTGTVITAKWPL